MWWENVRPPCALESHSHEHMLSGIELPVYFRESELSFRALAIVASYRPSPSPEMRASSRALVALAD